eukprot:5254415-Pyramimonas_sp.AAC.1
MFSLVVWGDEADAASVGDGRVVGDRGRAERFARALGRIGKGSEVVKGSVRSVNSEKSALAEVR